MSQHEFVAGCIAWYEESYLQPGNPEDGIWESAHYPVPKCLGGTETILLLKEHHAVQGVLQSEEYQHPCIYGWERQHLSGEVLDYWSKWMQVKGQLWGQKGDRGIKRASGLRCVANGHLDRIRPLRNRDTLRRNAEANLVVMQEYWSNMSPNEVSLKRSRAAGGKPFILTTPEGQEIHYNVIRQAERDHNINNLGLVLKGVYRQIKGYTARYTA